MTSEKAMRKIPATRPDIPRVKVVQEQERPTCKPPGRKTAVAIAWKEEVCVDLARDDRCEPE